MLKINKKIEYALMALNFMRNHPRVVPFKTREICSELNVPFDPMAKVMQVLNQRGILRSAQGVKGGYYLQANLRQLTYYELNIFLEGETFGDYCNGPRGVCEQFTHCNILGPLNRLNHKLIHFFKTITLEDLLNDPSEFSLTPPLEKGAECKEQALFSV